MGVVIKKLARAEFKDNANGYFEFEINKSDKVHVQNDAFRIEMKTEEFAQFASNIIDGANRLIEMKGLKI
tara:strand:+ start:262 stop:471 length:210 start_codon:yes stop_codon:yes gene_type:complete